MKYCINCKQLVDPQKKFNAILFIILLFTIIGWLFYLIYYAVKPKKCPMCNSTNWGVKPSEVQHQSPVVIPKATYCPECGTEILDKSKAFCSKCGAKIIN